MTDSMTGRDRERLADFLIMLKLWGCWSRGGLPSYRCALNTKSGGILPIDPDEAQFIDSGKNQNYFRRLENLFV